MNAHKTWHVQDVQWIACVKVKFCNHSDCSIISCRKVCKSCGCNLDQHQLLKKNPFENAIVNNSLRNTDNFVDVDELDEEENRAHPYVQEFTPFNISTRFDYLCLYMVQNGEKISIVRYPSFLLKKVFERLSWSTFQTPSFMIMLSWIFILAYHTHIYGGCTFSKEKCSLYLLR